MEIKKILTLNLMLFSLNAFSQEIYLNSVVIFDPQNSISSSDLITKNKYKYSLEGLKLPLNDRLSNKISQTNLKVMIFPGLNHVVFTDGSMMVKYSEYFASLLTFFLMALSRALTGPFPFPSHKILFPSTSN